MTFRLTTVTLFLTLSIVATGGCEAETSTDHAEILKTRPLTCEEGGRPCASYSVDGTVDDFAGALESIHGIDIEIIIKENGWESIRHSEVVRAKVRYSYSVGGAPAVSAEHKSDAPAPSVAATGHPPECGDADLNCTSESNVKTFSEFAFNIASMYTNVDAEDVIRHSGWEEYRDVDIIPGRFYAYSTGQQQAILKNR